MAVFKNDPFPGTNYGQYLSWEKVTTPQGQVLYVVPGNAAYVYDPVASNATGRKVFRPNPQKQIEDQQKAEQQQQELLDQQKFNQSPVGQILPVAAGTGGLILANQLMKPSDTGLQAVANALGKTGINPGAQAVTNAGVNSASNLGAAAAQGAQGVPGAIVGPDPGTMVTVGAPEGATMQSMGFVPESPMFGAGGSWYNTNGMLGPQGSFAPLNAAGAALGAYGVYNASQMGNKRQGAVSGALSGAAAGTAIAPGIGTAIGAGLGLIGGLAAHEKTKDRSKRRYGEIADVSNNPAYQAMLTQGMQEDISGADTWDKGDNKADAPIDLLTRSYGVLKTFGPDWANLAPEQQRSVVSALVDKDLINSKQGSYLIDDPAKAHQIADTILKPQGAAAASGAMQKYPRSKTRSPGIGLDGKPFIYGAS